ncbi:antitoxin VbhA family protein [Pseudochrobactrum sp. sp1633]|uniref:antitoxin VbhA family protein n=1 Tax=Pseudochrobactrum sp. sp1633 TaxID=3036706 RepID=UPI0025A68137|nr:antitoxin VbhA family protein [Pseudochrobactrum sp. sp1633]MDM8347037.1 antitoxin VbhA family protein [Pseudochrobactrum sp. sp1633]
MALAYKTHTPAISAEEMERRRKSVRRAIRSNAIEGAAAGPEMDPIYEAYIAGKIDSDEMLEQAKALRGS